MPRFQGCKHATLNIARIGPTPNLSTGLVPKCCVEDQESLSPLVVTLDAQSLKNSREASSYFRCLELQGNARGSYTHVSQNPSNISETSTAMAVLAIPLFLSALKKVQTLSTTVCVVVIIISGAYFKWCLLFYHCTGKNASGTFNSLITRTKSTPCQPGQSITNSLQTCTNTIIRLLCVVHHECPEYQLHMCTKIH